ncbi:MAG: hypothetical protein Q4G40_00380 [Brachybacterium sp.]|nr:hypothetical protein [Brachybacterium sp.]
MNDRPGPTDDTPARTAEDAPRQATGPGSPRRGPVVVSSLTGERLPWPEDAPEGTPPRSRNTARDSDLLRDVPPHWGTTR